MAGGKCIREAPSFRANSGRGAPRRSAAASCLRIAFAVLLVLGPAPLHPVAGWGPAQAASIVVVSSPADAGPGTLRAALAGAQSGDTILFDPAVFPPTAPATIALQSGLPAITADALTIDASNAGVILDGSSTTYSSGLRIVGAHGVTVRGLQVVKFPGYGISLTGGAADSVIGGSRQTGAAPLGQGNLISGNLQAGILLEDAGTSGNQVLGNIIGADLSGMHAMPNG